MKYSILADSYGELEATSKRLEKTEIVASLLKKTSSAELERVVLLLQGRVFLKTDESKIGVASKLIAKSLQIATGKDSSTITKEWKKTGDLGDVAQNLVRKKTQATLTSTDLTVEKVFNNIKKLAEIEGKGSVNIKLKMIAELLTSAKPKEAKFIVRTVLEDLRVGVGDGTLRDAISKAYLRGKEDVEHVQNAFDVTTDFGIVAKAAKKGTKELDKLEMQPGNPVKVMLYPKADGFEDAFERVGKPCIIEGKYDGFRVQVHKKGNEVKLFTRRLEDVSKQFPEVVALAKDHLKTKDAILDGEIVGFSKEKFLPFQKISQRIRRKHNIEEMIKEIPVVVRLFDVLELEGHNYINEPLKTRWKVLKQHLSPTKKFGLVDHKEVDNVKDAKAFYEASLAKGNEGAMMKNLDAPYKPGSRVGYGVKIKPTMESLDLVVVGADWGDGKRSKWLASFTLACKDGDSFKEIGKVGTGFKEKESEGVTFQEMTDRLKKLVIGEKERHVYTKPKLIIEVIYEEIQASKSYSSGYALRFPRVVRIRDDKSLSDVNSIKDVERLYNSQ